MGVAGGHSRAYSLGKLDCRIAKSLGVCRGFFLQPIWLTGLVDCGLCTLATMGNSLLPRFPTGTNSFFAHVQIVPDMGPDYKLLQCRRVRLAFVSVLAF